MSSKVPGVKLNNGLEMPILGIGTWKSKPNEVTEAVKIAIDAGYRHIDCAFVYRNEHEVGLGIKEKITEGVVKREDLFVVSKLWGTSFRPDLVVPALKKTLSNFGLDYLDLYLLHSPNALKPTEGDEFVFIPTENGKTAFSDVDYVDTWKEMEKCVDLGLTKSIGVSNFNSQQIERLVKNARIKPVTNQVECHPYLNQKKLIQFCKERDITITAYSPFGAPDSINVGPEVPRPLTHDVVLELAKKYNKSPGQILLRYHVDRGNIVIPKSVNKSRIEENINIFDFKLSSEDLEKVNNIDHVFRFSEWAFAKGGPHYPFDAEF